MTIRVPCVLICLLAVPGISSGYNLNTHARLAQQAVLGSRLSSDPALRDAVGLPAPSDPNATLPGKQSVVDIPIKLIAEGVRLEDLDPSEKRVINHFFDPVHPDLRIAPGACLSPDFALGDPPSAPCPLGELYDTKDSYKDARTYLFQALTAPTRVDRDAKLGRMFVSIGQVIHHLQDMAQPQRTRNDRHAGRRPYKIFGPPSLYEAIVEETFGRPHRPGIR